MASERATGSVLVFPSTFSLLVRMWRFGALPDSDALEDESRPHELTSSSEPWPLGVTLFGFVILRGGFEREFGDNVCGAGIYGAECRIKKNKIKIKIKK